MVIAVEAVTFGYAPGLPAAVEGVTADLEAGRVTALLGPNAAGKSTLLKLMLGQLAPRSGRVLLEGEPVSALPPRARARRVSYVPQRGSVSFAFTVREVVEMGRFAGGTEGASEAVERAIDACGVRGIERRIFAELSAGQQQAVLVARAFAQAAGTGRAMLLDEPGSSMDLRHAHALMRLLRGVANAAHPPVSPTLGAGLAVLIVLHDINLAARYADDVWLMHEGRLVAAGPWQEVLRPEVLEPVYGVGLRALSAAEGGNDRPVFLVEPGATLVA